MYTKTSHFPAGRTLEESSPSLRVERAPLAAFLRPVLASSFLLALGREETSLCSCGRSPGLENTLALADSELTAST